MPTLTLTDTFTAANGTHVSSRPPDLGPSWEIAAGDFASFYTISSNRGRSTAVSKGPFITLAADVLVTADLDVAAANFMSIRTAGSATFTGGLRARISKLDNKIQVFDSGGNNIKEAAKTISASTTYPVTVAQYRGHLKFTVGADTIHAWNYDYILGGPDSGYAARVPSGTRVGPDWTSTNDGFVDNINISTLARADAYHICGIGDSITPFVRTSSTDWPVTIAQALNDGITQLRTYCGGGEGLSKGGSSSNTALNQAQNIVTNADDPDLVIIHLGTNDDAASVAATGKSVQTLMARYWIISRSTVSPRPKSR
jgi:hypothetical protein